MILALLQLCRPYYAMPISLTYLLTVYYARGGAMGGHWAEDCLSAAALALTIASAYVLNDVFDRDVDRINTPSRPLPSGSLRPAVAGAWGGLLAASALGLAALCSARFLAAMAALSAALVAYDLFSKRLGPLKQVVVALLMTSYYPLAVLQTGGLAGPRAGSLLVFPVWLLITAWGYELFKDLRDRLGDPPIGGRPTFLQLHPRRWTRLAGLVVMGASPMLVLPMFLGCKWVYMIGAILAIGLAVASAMVSIRWAIRLIYLECFITALAAAMDVAVLGI